MTQGGGSDGEDRLTRRVMMALALALAVALAASLVGAYVMMARGQRQAMDDGAATVRALLHLQIDRDAAMMHAAIEGLTRDPALRAAMQRGDRDELRRRIESLYDELRATHRIVRLTFIDPGRQLVLRAHDPDYQPGEVVERPTLLDAVGKGSESYGLEMGPLGTLTLRMVIPWHSPDGTLIGYVELGEEVGPMAEEIHRILDLDLLMLVRKDLLDRDKWEEGQRRYGRHDSWDALNSMVAVAQTTQSIPGALAVLVDEGSQPRKLVMNTENGRRKISVNFVPLSDVNGQELGEMVVLRDVTAAQRLFIRVMGVAVGVALLGGLAAAAWAAARVVPAERALRRTAEEHLRLALLSQDAIIPQPADLVDLVHQAAGRLERRAFRRQPPPQLDLPDGPAPVVADATLLVPALAALLAEAVAAAADGQAFLHLHRAADGWELSVEPLPPATEPPAAGPLAEGLSWALLRHALRLHGGRMTHQTGPHGGNRMVLWLPGVTEDGETQPNMG